MIALMLLPTLSPGQNYHCQWVHTAGNSAITTISGQDVNSSGNVYVTGIYLNGNLNFDNSTTTLNPNQDTTDGKIFITKYDPDGHLLWTKAFQSGGFAQSLTITIDNQDNIYLTGLFSDNITFGTIILTQNQPNASSEKFLAKFDSSGNVLWAKKCPSLAANYAVSKDGNIALYGAFIKPSITLGNNLTLTNSDSSGQTFDFLIAELDNNGNLLWAKSGGVSGKSEEIDHIAFTSNDQIYVSGLFESTLTLDGITLNSIGNTSWDVKDWFLARYNINGNVPWAMRGGICHIAPLQLKDGAPLIKTDPFNNLYFVGNFHDSTMQVDSLILNGNGNLSGSVVANTVDEYWYAGKCDGKELLWAKSGNSPVVHIQFIPANDGGLYLTGIFRDTAIFGNITLNGTSSGNQTFDGFAVKLDNFGQVSWAKHFGPLLRAPTIFDMVVDQQNTLAILGAYGDPKGQIPNIMLQFDSLSLTSVDYSRDYFLARYKDNGDILSASNIGSPAVEGLTSGQLSLVGKSDLYVSGVYSATPFKLDSLTVNFPVPNLNNYFVAKYSDSGTTTGINDAMFQHSLKVFPNPTTGMITLQSTSNMQQIQLFNLEGRIIYQKKLAQLTKQFQVNLKGQASGVYWLEIQSKTGVAVKKIVLKN